MSLNCIRPRSLLAGHLVHHPGEAIDVLDQHCATLSLYDAQPRQPVELSCDGLAMRAYAACDLGMGRRRINAGRIAVLRGQFGKPQEFRLDAIADGKCTELVHARRERSYLVTN